MELTGADYYSDWDTKPSWKNDIPVGASTNLPILIIGNLKGTSNDMLAIFVLISSRAFQIQSHRFGSGFTSLKKSNIVVDSRLPVLRRWPKFISPQVS